MKRFGIVLMATVGLAGLAHAADLPTTKAPAAAPPQNCLANLWNWLNSSPNDCPLTYAGITLYGTLDVGLSYLSEGVGTTRAPTSSTTSFRKTPIAANGSPATTA